MTIMTQVVRHLRPFLLRAAHATKQRQKNCKMALFSFHMAGKAGYAIRIMQGAADHLASANAKHR